MRWDPDLRRPLGSAVLLLTLAACADVAPPTLTVDPEPTRQPTQAPPTQRPTPSPTDGTLAEGLPRPGRPYDADDILEAMRQSRRPGGVPDALQTDSIARRIAAEIWTVDGEPWSTISAGGSCGPARCTLDLAGSRAGAAGDDLWSFEIIPAGDEVIVLDTNLRSMPENLLTVLDVAARDDLPAITRQNLLLAGVRWVPPPDEPGFVLSYRAGDEEGSCELELALDPSDGAVEVLSQSGC